MIGEGHTCDIWQPSQDIGDQNKVLTAEYTLNASAIECRFHEIRSRERMELGIAIDATVDLQSVVFKGAAITELEQYWIIKYIEEGSYWLVNLPVMHQTKPKEYWRCTLEKLNGLPAEIAASYD
jgi:hypothetical protein